MPCVLSSVTSFNVTIPKDAFPAAAEMKIWSELYDSHQPGKDPGGFVSPDKGGARFNLTGGTGAWSDFELKNGWSVFGSNAYQMPCDMIACARKCVQDNLDASKPGFSQTYNKGPTKLHQGVRVLDRKRSDQADGMHHGERGRGQGTGIERRKAVGSGHGSAG